MDSKQWLDMINTHVRWKQRLEAYILGIRAESFDVQTVAKDNLCILGKWIYSNTQAYQGVDIFEQVRLNHAELHTDASRIISLADAQKIDEANELLHGAFSEISHRFKRDIVMLSKQILNA